MTEYQRIYVLAKSVYVDNGEAEDNPEHHIL